MVQREADEFDRLETEYPQGISAAQIVDFFAPKGVRLAQATFRKYVQLGLLPRSRRVGEKGKHRGSRGLYPASAARRIHLIKSLMDEGMTLEDIRGSFVFFRGQLDGVERSLDEIFAALDKCDLFLCVGSSGAVHPAAGFVSHLRHTGRARCIYLGLERPDNAYAFDECRLGKAGELLPGLVDLR